MTLIAIVIICVLIALNALFVAAEFAIVGASRTSVAQLAAEGSARAHRIERVMADPRLRDRYIVTSQLGITAASLGLGMYAEPLLASWIMEWLAFLGSPAWLASHALAGIIALLGLTYLHIVLGEMVPKGVALAKPVRVALWLSPVMRLFQTATYPLIVLLDNIGAGILRGIGVPRRLAATQLHTARELHHIIRDAERRGLLRHEAADVVAELIGFVDLSAHEVMVPRVKIFGIEVGATPDELTELVVRAPHARYPVYAHDLDHIVGMVHIRDIARRIRQRSGIRQSDIRSIPFVPGSATLDTVLAAMTAATAQMAVIMDEHGGTDGIITTEDLYEEVVGDIEDPHSLEPPEIYTDGAGRVHVAGTARVEDLGEHLDIPLEHEDVDTVSGLVLALLDRPPRVGDRVSYDGVELEVLAVAGRGVSACRVVDVSRPSDSDEQFS